MNAETEVAASRLTHELMKLAREQRLGHPAYVRQADPADGDRLARERFYLDAIIGLCRIVDHLLVRGGHARPDDIRCSPLLSRDDPAETPRDRECGLLAVRPPAFEPLEPDFSKCRWVRHHDVLRFNEVQAAVVSRLYRDWTGDRKGVPVAELLRDTRRQFEPRLDQVFRVKHAGKWGWHPAWEKKLVRRLGRGEYRLDP